MPSALLTPPGSARMRIAAVPLARALGLAYRLVDDDDTPAVTPAASQTFAT